MVELLGVLAIGGGVVLLLRVLNVIGPAGGGRAPVSVGDRIVAAQVDQGIPVQSYSREDAYEKVSWTFAVNPVTPADPTFVYLANAMQAGAGPRPE